MYVAITGRQQELSLAELESLFGADALLKLNSENVFIDHEEALRHFPRLGSTISLARVLGRFSGDIQSLADTLDYDALLREHRRKKISLAVSVYGKTLSKTQHQHVLGTLSSRLKKHGKSVREIRSKQQALSSAQVFHNRLDDIAKNCEVICSFDVVSKQWVIAQTVAVQNITAYRVRDRERPKRDSYVGMLPPKLAQTLINLTEVREPDNKTLLDPFCGTGVILQEAAIMGFEVYGTDVSEKMIDYSQQNLDWLKTPHLFKPKLEVGDSTTHTWGQPIDVVVSEMYLGRPMRQTPPKAELAKLKDENKHLLVNFLKNIHPQLKPETPLVLAIPAWRTGKETFESAIGFDDLKKLGYNPVEFQHVDNDSLIYAREQQFVGRKLLVLRRN